MAVELKVPKIGESITEVQIGPWLIAEGASAEADAPVVVIETEKATVEIPAPVGGVVTQVLKKQGEMALVGEVIGYMEEGGSARATAPKAKSMTPAPTQAAEAPRATGISRVKQPLAGPAARRAMAEAGLAPEDVEGTGPAGRIRNTDVQRALGDESVPASVPAPVPAPVGELEPAPAPAPGSSSRAPQPTNEARAERIVPMTRMRKTIASRLVQAQQQAALLTTFNEADMSAVMALREEHKQAFIDRYGVKPGFMSFFVKASVDALKLVPQVNAEIRGDAIAYRDYYDVGIAVGGGKGLVVPVIRDAHRLDFAGIELAIADFGKRAKDGTLKPDELSGGTFTISNGGVYGSMLSTPIVNPPQSGILGLHAIQDRPVARNGQVVIRPMMYLALTYDHRLVDGREAVTFLKRIKDTIESPARLLLGI